jgi:hypothetical protein
VLTLRCDKDTDTGTTDRSPAGLFSLVVWLQLDPPKSQRFTAIVVPMPHIPQRTRISNGKLAVIAGVCIAMIGLAPVAHLMLSPKSRVRSTLVKLVTLELSQHATAPHALPFAPLSSFASKQQQLLHHTCVGHVVAAASSFCSG